MKIKLAAALLLFLIAVSCSSSKLNSGLDAELQPRNEPVKIGEMAPNFTLEDQNGQKVNLSALRGSGPTVLAFYRGNWWPYCAQQLAELRFLKKPNESFNLLAISVDTPAQSREFAAKIAADGKGKIDYQILSDPGHRVIDAFGIRDPDYNGQKFEGIPRPTVYVIDKTGRITWMKVELNYQERPTNEDIRAALNTLT